LCLLLAAGTLAFYNPIADNEFIDFDDSAYIVANPHVQHGITWNTVKWAFTTFHAGYWHPLTWLSHALDCQLFQLNPVGHHYVNLLLHTACAVVLFLLLRNATGRTLGSFIVSALFALHPVNVESVAWAAERKNVLSMLFFLLAMCAYTRYARTGRKTLYFTVIVLFALGLMAKPQIVTLPFVLLLWDYWPLARLDGDAAAGNDPGGAPRSLRFLVLEKVPLFILAAADCFVIVLSQRAGNAMRTASEVPWSLRLENAIVSYVRYLGKAFWPSRLAPMYPLAGRLLPWWQVAGAAALLAFLSFFLLRWRGRRYLLVGWLWFLGTLVPMIGIITVGEQAMADRFAYIPYIGLFMAVVWSADDFLSEHGMPRFWLAGAAGAVLVAIGLLTYRQLAFWRDDETLWRYTLTVTDDNYMAHDNLAYALALSGRAKEAISEFRAARQLHQYPGEQIVKLAHYELGMGYPQEALEECRAALGASADPLVREAALQGMGRALLELHRYDEADESYGEALRLSPDDGQALLNSGLLALRSGDLDHAVARFSKAAQANPNAVNLLLLAQALARSGHSSDASRALARARNVSTNFEESQKAVGQFLALAELKPL